MKFGFRTPSLKKRLAARTSIKRIVRHSLGVKAPRGMGWFTNPKKAVYNRVYNRTTVGLGKGCLIQLSVIVGFFVLVVALVKTVFSRPETTYLVRLEGKSYKYELSEAKEKKYFVSVPGWTYTYATQAPAPDTPEARKEIARILLPAYLNHRVATAKFENLIKLKRGYCVPSVMLANGDEAAIAYAVDFLSVKGQIAGFVVGQCFKCSMMPKAK